MISALRRNLAIKITSLLLAILLWGMVARDLRNRYLGHSVPVAITMALTYRCNLRCPHCASDSGLARDDELSTADWS